MPHTLFNDILQLTIDLPHENYQVPRFDQTGKITGVKYKDLCLTTTERPGGESEHFYGKGLYNEFGIDQALGFEEIDKGEWFHKIGVGLLQKGSNEYRFAHHYPFKPAHFTVSPGKDQVDLQCVGEKRNGYAYILTKKIGLVERGFNIRYELKNTGDKEIRTTEYVHNFMGLPNEVVGPEYLLQLPFQIKQSSFHESVNPTDSVLLTGSEVNFRERISKPFFFSHLNGNSAVKGSWRLVHQKKKISISEHCDFMTKKVNLWGWQHVISPELFKDIVLLPGQSDSWTRTFEFLSLAEA